MTIYSHSRLETFQNCPLKYKFNYIDKIKREEEGIGAFLGSCFHEVMEKIYKDLPFRKYSLDELLQISPRAEQNGRRPPAGSLSDRGSKYVERCW